MDNKVTASRILSYDMELDFIAAFMNSALVLNSQVDIFYIRIVIITRHQDVQHN